MKKLIMVASICLMVSGCGVSQKNLRAVNDLLEKSKTADCETIHTYLGVIQKEIQKQIK